MYYVLVCSVKRCAAKRVKTIALSKETKTPHSASSLLVQANSAMAPPSVGGAFTMKLGQQAVAMAKALTNQLACQVGESGVLTWKEGINWNEVLPLTRLPKPPEHPILLCSYCFTRRRIEELKQYNVCVSIISSCKTHRCRCEGSCPPCSGDVPFGRRACGAGDAVSCAGIVHSSRPLPALVHQRTDVHTVCCVGVDCCCCCCCCCHGNAATWRVGPGTQFITELLSLVRRHSSKFIASFC